VRGFARIYVVRMAQFVLKIDKLSHNHRCACPRLWLLIAPRVKVTHYSFDGV